MMLKIGVFERAGAAPLAGICPSCHRVMDESGCRVVLKGDPAALTPLAHELGIGRIYEIWCHGPSPTHAAQIEWAKRNPLEAHRARLLRELEEVEEQIRLAREAESRS